MRRRTTAAALLAVGALLMVEAPAVHADEPVTPRFGPVPEALGTFNRVDSGRPQEPGSAVVNGRLVFAAVGPAKGVEPWVTDGTPEGTHLLADLHPTADSVPKNFVSFGGLVWFSAYRPGIGREWWVTDGTPAGTRLFADLYPGEDAGTFPTDPVVLGDRLFFQGASPGAGTELMVTDGTVAGTRVAVDTRPGQESGYPDQLTAFGSQLVYRAEVADGVYKPFVTDRSQMSTARLDAEPLQVDLRPDWITVAGDRIFFRGGRDGTGVGRELWSSGGLPGDARPVEDIESGPGGSSPTELTALADRLYFFAYQSTTGRELWTSDGTPDGTHIVRDLVPPTVGTEGPTDLKAAAGMLQFRAGDGVHGQEPWVSDGTAAGTRLLADLRPGSTGSDPSSLGVIDGRHLFSAFAGSGGEPWITDGTTAGTRMVADLAPGAGSSNPYGIGVLGKTLVFATQDSGTDPVTLHAVTVPTSATTAKHKRKPYSHQVAQRRRIVLRVKVSATTPLSGTVTLTRKGRVVGTAQLVNGKARVRITKRLKAGKHRIRVTYSGSIDAHASSTRTVVKVRPKPRKR